MASARKRFNLKGKRDDDPAAYAEFIGDLLAGTIKATDLIETRQGNGKLRIDYDDPNG